MTEILMASYLNQIIEERYESYTTMPREAKLPETFNEEDYYYRLKFFPKIYESKDDEDLPRISGFLGNPDL